MSSWTTCSGWTSGPPSCISTHVLTSSWSGAPSSPSRTRNQPVDIDKPTSDVNYFQRLLLQPVDDVEVRRCSTRLSRPVERWLSHSEADIKSASKWLCTLVSASVSPQAAGRREGVFGQLNLQG